MRDPQPLHRLSDDELIDRIRAACPPPRDASRTVPKRVTDYVMTRIGHLWGAEGVAIRPPRDAPEGGPMARSPQPETSHPGDRLMFERAAAWALAAAVVVIGLFIWRDGDPSKPSVDFPLPATALTEVNTGSWAISGELVTPRGESGLALLADGRVLAVAGRNDWFHTQLLREAEAFDPKTGQWTSTGSLQTARMWFGGPVVLNDGRVLVAGGTNSTGYESMDTAEVFDPTKGEWNPAGTLHHGRRHGTMQLLDDGRVLIASGSRGMPDGARFLGSSEVYDPSFDRWDLVSGVLGVARERHWSARLLGGLIMVGNGEGPWMKWGDSAETYDPSAGTWSPAGKLSVGRFAPAVVTLNDGRVMVMGGANGDGGTTVFDSVDLYDPATGRWAPAAPMRRARVEHAAVLLRSGKVLVFGGHNLSGPVAECEIYDPATNAWRDDTRLPDPRLSTMAITLNDGRVLAVGGWESSSEAGVLRHGTRFSALYTPR